MGCVSDSFVYGDVVAKGQLERTTVGLHEREYRTLGPPQSVHRDFHTFVGVSNASYYKHRKTTNYISDKTHVTRATSRGKKEKRRMCALYYNYVAMLARFCRRVVKLATFLKISSAREGPSFGRSHRPLLCNSRGLATAG